MGSIHSATDSVDLAKRGLGDDWDTYIAQWMRAGGEAVLAEARAQHAGM